MKDLIDSIISFLESAITAGTIAIAGEQTVSAQKGLWDDPTLVPFNKYPYIAIDDAGERVEEAGSNTAQTRIYTIVIAMGVFNADISKSLDNILTLSNLVKAEFEKLSNRKKDSHIWGINIVPFQWEDERGFFRGRTVTIDFVELETKISDY